MAVTEDVFVLQRLRWDILKEYDKGRGARISHRKPVPSQIALHPRSHVLDHETIVPNVASKIKAEVYGSDVLSVVDLGLKLRRLILKAGETELANTVTAAIASIQNIAGLPGHARQFHDFLTGNYSSYEKQYHGSRFDHLTPRGQIISALQQGLGGVNQEKLSEFLKGFDKICDKAATNNSGGVLFEECILSLVDKPNRSIVVFPSKVLLSFAKWRLENDSALSSARSSLGRKLVLTGHRDAIKELESNQQEQTLYHRIVFFEPRVEDFLRVLARPWVPEKVFVLANLALADNLLKRLRILLTIDGIDPVRESLRAIQEELARALSGRIINVPDFDLVPAFPRLGTLDLTDAEPGTPDSGETRLISTSDDLQIRAFDGSEMALYDADALQSFSLKLAKDLEPGNEICVLSPDFMNMVRKKLTLTANASEVLALYHRTVDESVRKLPSRDIASKVQALRKRMLDIEPTLILPGNQAMRQWIDVSTLIDAPRNEVRPQAPRDRHHYLCFMQALGISDDLARQYWDLGIVWTRSIRISRGSTFRQIFNAILIDPHSAASRLPKDRRQDVRWIYEAAKQHIVTVISNVREVKR